MPALTVKNIPDGLYDQLKASAQVHRRSVNSELICCLESVLMPRKMKANDLMTGARTLRQQVKATRIGSQDIDAAKNMGRE